MARIVGIGDESASSTGGICSWPTQEDENDVVVVHVNDSRSSTNYSTFSNCLRSCVRRFRRQKKKAVLLKLPSDYYNKFLFRALQVGFQVHCSYKDHMMLILRLEEDEPSTLPANASNQVDAGPCASLDANLQQIIDPDRCRSTLGQSHGSLGQQSDPIVINATFPFPPSGPMPTSPLMWQAEGRWPLHGHRNMGNEDFGELLSVTEINFGVPVASPRTDHESRRKWKVLQGVVTSAYLADAFQIGAVFHCPGNFEQRKVDLPRRDLAELYVRRSGSAVVQELSTDYLREFFRCLCEDLPTTILPVRVHRDLKPVNVLVRAEAENFRLALPRSYNFELKLVDFGASRHVLESEPHGSSSSGLGTTVYMAPEILQKETFSKASDVYSFGMTCYEVLTGRIPFSDTLQFVALGALGGMRISYPCKPLRNKEQRKFLNHLCDQEWSGDGHSEVDVSTFINGECGMKDIPVNLVPLGSIQLDGTNEHQSQANYVFQVKVNIKLKGEPAQAIMDDSAASLESQAEVSSSRSLPFVGLQGLGQAGKSTFSNEVKRAFLKKHDEEDGDVKNEVSAIINGECGIQAMEEQTGIVQMDADLPSSADLGELLCDESDSETEEFDIPSEDEGWSGESAASRESQAEVTSDSHVPQTEPSQNAGRKRSAASAFGEDDLIAKIGSFVNKQIEVALQPLMCALRSRDEDEQRHCEKMLAIEKEKLALIRQRMLFTSSVLANSNAVRAKLQVMRQNLDDLKLHGAPRFDVRKCSQINADSKAPDDLSFLHIPFSAIEVGDPIKALPATLNKGDAHLEGRALVHTGRWNGCDYAIKVFKSSALHWNTEELSKEVALLMKVQHPHIVQFIGCTQNEEKTYVLYERMDCDLRELIKTRIEKNQSILGSSNRPFSHTVEVDIIVQLARAMSYLHEQNCVHRDLKCTNVLVKQVGGHIHVKVSDFHCSRELGQTPRNAMYKPTHRVRWMSPEAFGHYNVEQPADEVLKRADVYSFAMTCYEVVTGCYPFDGIRGDAVLKKMILAGDRPTLPADLSDSLKKLIQNCWAANPEARPSFKEICYVLQNLRLSITHGVQSLPARFGFGNPRVADEPEDEEWSFKDEMGSATDDVAKDLPHYLQINPANLKPIQKLGEGASAEVFAASWVGCKFAVKWLKSDHVPKLRHEVGILMTLQHPHVLRLLGFSVMARANRCGIVMELMESSLREFMDEKMKATPKPFSEAEAVQIITKLALGMAFLHSRGVAHRDLKCANVLVRNVKEFDEGYLVVKLADFGLSHLESRIESKPSVVGTHYWRAPELLSMESRKPVPYDLPKLADVFSADVYSFGMVCYEIITGKVPNLDVTPSVAKELVKVGITPKLDSINVGKALKDLLKDCWCLAPQNRLTFPTICKRLAAMSYEHPHRCTALGESTDATMLRAC